MHTKAGRGAARSCDCGQRRAVERER